MAKIVTTALVCLLLIAGTAAIADTVGLNLSNLGDYGYSTTVVADSSGRGSVTEKLWGTETTMQFTNGNKDLTSRCWSTLSTANYDGVALSQITALNIRVYGIEGDGTDWQPPTFHFALKKAADNPSNRFATWIPWADGTPRAPGTWQTYNALVDGQWYIPWVSTRYSTLQDMLTAYPGLTFANAAEIQTMMSGYAGKSFNIGNADWVFEVQPYEDSARGVVDWFEVGVNGVNTTYYLDEVVPEPSSIAALAVGLVGLIGLRRRR